MRNLDVHPDFYTQLSKYMLDFEEHRSGYGLLFHSEVSKTLKQILTFPLASTAIKENLRRLNVKRFPLTVIYSVEPQTLKPKILTVAHLHRGPDFWKTKLKQFTQL